MRSLLVILLGLFAVSPLAAQEDLSYFFTPGLRKVWSQVHQRWQDRASLIATRIPENI